MCKAKDFMMKTLRLRASKVNGDGRVLKVFNLALDFQAPTVGSLFDFFDYLDPLGTMWYHGNVEQVATIFHHKMQPALIVDIFLYNLKILQINASAPTS